MNQNINVVEQEVLTLRSENLNLKESLKQSYKEAEPVLFTALEEVLKELNSYKVAVNVLAKSNLNSTPKTVDDLLNSL